VPSTDWLPEPGDLVRIIGAKCLHRRRIGKAHLVYADRRVLITLDGFGYAYALPVSMLRPAAPRERGKR
jgi:hypothetical protein